MYYPARFFYKKLKFTASYFFQLKHRVNLKGKMNPAYGKMEYSLEDWNKKLPKYKIEIDA